MIEQLGKDLADVPRAFDLGLPVDTDGLERLAGRVGDQLCELWRFAGIGDLFETEEIFGPTLRPSHALDVRNAELHDAGLSADLIAFHAGLELTAIDHDGLILALDRRTFAVLRTFASLDEWYAHLRREYADAYGLRPAAPQA